MPARETERSLGLLVVGMHRSGTSMLAHLLGALRFSFGGELVQAAADNPLGYWEHAGVVSAHDSFLALAGRSWDDPGRWPAGAFELPEAEATRRRLEEIVERDLSTEPRWVVKDPRICRLLPLWSGILADPRLGLRFLHLVRRPLSVAASLAARDGFSTGRSLLLWLRHNLEAERATRRRPRAWIRWEELTADPAPILERAFDALGLGGLFERNELAAAGRAVLERGAIHHRVVDSAELDDAFPWVRDADRAFGLLVEGENAEAERMLDAIDAEMTRSERQLLVEGGGHPGGGDARLVGSLKTLEKGLRAHQADLSTAVETLRRSLSLIHSADRRLLGRSLRLLEETEQRHVDEIDGLRATGESQREQIQELESRVETGAAEAERLRATLDAVFASRSWRMTRPMRGVLAWIRRDPTGGQPG